MNVKWSFVGLFLTACSANVDAGHTAQSELSSSDGTAGCFWGAIASKTANADGCESDTDLQNDAQLVCSAKGFGLTTFEGDEACGKGSSQQAKYECCPPQQPPLCVTQTIGDGKQCESDAQLEKLGVSTCAAMNATLARIIPDEGCPSVPPEGASYFATIDCCY